MEKPSDNQTEPPSELDQIKTDLVDFAIDREELMFIMARWTEEAKVKSVRVEYELVILKIIAVGWSLSYYLQQSPIKEQLQNQFWLAIQEFSASLSETTGLMIGQDIDYFTILKERLETYVEAMGGQSQDADPAQVVGPVFADLCGDKEDIFASMAGGKMFNNTLIRIRQYLEAVKLV